MMISFARTSSFCWVSSLNVLQVGRAEDVGQPRAADFVGDHLRGEREIIEQPGELTRGLGMKLLLLDDEPLDCYDGCRCVLDHFRDPCRGCSARAAAPNTVEHRFRRRYESNRNEVTAKGS